MQVAQPLISSAMAPAPPTITPPPVSTITPPTTQATGFAPAGIGSPGGLSAGGNTAPTVGPWLTSLWGGQSTGGQQQQFNPGQMNQPGGNMMPNNTGNIPSP
jgi:hypothetical protein